MNTTAMNAGPAGHETTTGNETTTGHSTPTVNPGPPGNPTGGPAPTWNSATGDSGQAPGRPPTDNVRRPAANRMLAGVAAGIARYFGVDVTVVRIAFAVLTFIGGAGVPIYLAGWLLIPDEESNQSIADGLIQSWRARRR